MRLANNLYFMHKSNTKNDIANFLIGGPVARTNFKKQKIFGMNDIIPVLTRVVRLNLFFLKLDQSKSQKQLFL